ncbi:ribonuclease III [Anabaena cylindrica FACHB-243]|uniref:Mini-ribonuclease 3 n=1 Tax=Anabaena cylindrica (strain ATCC 27899 / PCC 7122) TaxID=272123 RepID=K9ZJT4_ANACC|nr:MULTISPECIES: ribonuclease III domain-containing protein [Anabaena]AFZ59034.1 ribonuclease III [Anabaena cylindrica PCC 7122]MBD2420626.1 ribonuclease III [Anabaena cylindrica FACHB-243]MBY5285509.1 ribonuclease III [Anabaena sp. CCAP 1446/1C]MBY5309400.1 ribonuclease III [Anabaena sp. CCAP 1446/1C]MCM2408586.1 ribonuclease III [Anabaena sp. CCAP 1446/1C]
MKPQEEEAKKRGDETARQDSSEIPALLVNTTQLPQTIISQAQVRQLSPSALAYLGDSIYELYVRMFFLLPQQRPEIYHSLVVAQVRAETQALHLRSLTPELRSNELEIVRRGRNAATSRPKRLNPEIYQQATSLETLVGYLYLTDYPRLMELLQKLHLEK